jgi:hypothetical protein
MTYVAPKVTDYGTLVEITAGTPALGSEDGPSKNPFHKS